MLSIAVLAIYSWSQAKPIDSKVAIHLLNVREFFERPHEERSLSEYQSARYLQMANSDNLDLRLVGILMLAYANDAPSSELLEKLSEKPSPLIAGAAQYARKMRTVRDAKPDVRMSALTLWIGGSGNAFERLFLANRLAVDFGRDARKVIFLAAQEEQDPIVRCDMLYYLWQSNDSALATKALAWRWDIRIRIPDNIAFLLGSITPGRSRGSAENSVDYLLRQVKELSNSQKVKNKR